MQERFLPAQPASPVINWWPMLFSLPILFLLSDLARRGNGTILDWAVTISAVLVHFALFATAVLFWQRGRPFLWVIPALVLLCALLALQRTPGNHVAALFLVFAAALAPWAANGAPLRTASLALLLVGVAVFEGWLVAGDWGLRHWWQVNVPVMTLVLAAGSLQIVKTSLSMHRLAKVAERERIARDLHDVLGHTLTLITLKTELAGWLLSQGRDPGRARAEIAEVERISLQALADVRGAIGGCMDESLDQEVSRATSTLQTAGIAVECEREDIQIDSLRESVLCLALREAVTNVVRHAGARNCCIRLQPRDDFCLLEIRDDGRGGVTQEGQGLRGMRERVEACGGSVSRQVSAGTCLTIRLPAPRAAA